jgi:hypothetical protein
MIGVRAPDDGIAHPRRSPQPENFRRRWVFMDAKGLKARLELPTQLLEKLDRWVHENFSDPRAAPVLRRMTADLDARVLTGGMLVKEFLTQRLAPLQSHTRPCGSSRARRTTLGCARGA